MQKRAQRSGVGRHRSTATDYCKIRVCSSLYCVVHLKLVFVFQGFGNGLRRLHSNGVPLQAQRSQALVLDNL